MGVLRNRELMEITLAGYDGEKEDFDRAANGLSISTKEELLDVIYRAKNEGWDSLVLELGQVAEIPSEIGELTELRYLQFDRFKGGGISVILPKEIGNLKKLEYFSAYKCNIKELPEEFADLQNVKYLYLNGNNFEEFPKVILNLKKLESLAINYSFHELPDGICDLVHLKYLYCPGADINSLPERIGNLVDLEILCLWGTKISRLPDSCIRLTNIKSLYLTRSIFENILPPEIAAQSPREAINYILKYQSDHEKKQVNESKMIIVGQGGVGKTCLLNRLIFNQYDETVSTEGIDIASWKFTVRDMKYKLNVWDFGGQEIYHATHQFFLTNRSLYIFVWDARQEEEYGRIDYWLHTIESFACDSPIMIVVNKCDSRNNVKQLDLKDIKERFPQIIDFFKVSCKENYQIDELRTAIEEETTRLPLMGVVWLSSWLNVRKELEELSKSLNIITYKQYLQICKRFNIYEVEALSLSKYLHDLGIIINFQNDLYLKDIVILNPDWGTNAVYKVLDARDTILKDRNGILYDKDLPSIWENHEEYPVETYLIILRLMENFQLSFEVEKNKEYLIAELLDNEEIEFDIEEEDTQPLNFQYNYEFLPAGLMTRFIVKSNAYLVEKNGKKACWKKGAYLQNKKAFGIVRLFDGITERKIEIKVYGASKRAKQELLVIIRKYFDEIHGSIPKIKYTEYVRCNCRPDCTYLHEYRYILELEERQLQYERCKKSFDLVEVSKLLDGVESVKQRKSRKEYLMNKIQVNPTIEITNSNTNTNTNVSKNEITIEIRSSINEMYGAISDLKDEVLYEDSNLEKEFDKLEKSIEKLDKAETKEEVVKSGTMNKVRRFLDELQDDSTEIGKVMEKVKYGVEIAQNIGEKYNAIAEWCGMPVIPKVFLKK